MRDQGEVEAIDQLLPPGFNAKLAKVDMKLPVLLTRIPFAEYGFPESYSYAGRNAHDFMLDV